MKRRAYLAAYDIADSKRLRRVAKCLSQVGIRMQYSLFYLPLSVVERVALLQELAGLIKADEDDVRLYPVPKRGKITVLGREPFPDDIVLLDGEHNVLRWEA
ncbi:MAG: CRISPR-associated endonuclease Cas2 [Gammaproteobacteria bacterium]|nr:CRISPR-associated endonuclease Cas2 [Gammaproteobacteria bacterium]